MSRSVRLKQARRQAERMTVGMKAVAYWYDSGGARRLSTKCTRGVYKIIKRVGV